MYINAVEIKVSVPNACIANHILKMSIPTYGGDEISAIVIDQGSRWTRAGYAGEDAPKAVVPTHYGKINDAYLFGDNNVQFPRSNLEIQSCMDKDGLVSDWDASQRLWEYCFNDVLAADMKEHPLLMTEQLWNTDSNRQKAMEIAFETLDVPAFYIVKRPACSIFASGKANGLVINVGAAVSTATPVVDGLVLFKPSQRTRVAGNYVNDVIKTRLAQPTYSIDIDADDFVTRDAFRIAHDKIEHITKSYKQFQRQAVVEEFKETIVQVSPTAIKLSDTVPTSTNNSDTRTFEFPDRKSSVSVSEAESQRLGESLFQPKGGVNALAKGQTENIGNAADIEPEAEDPTQDMTTKDKELYTLVHTDRRMAPFQTSGISDMVVRCIESCDVDIRANLANNIVVSGGTTLTQGFTDRLNEDLTSALPGYKIRMSAPGNIVERKFSAWIGASILASLGTFHQLWISKKEYQEVGASKLLEKRFR